MSVTTDQKIVRFGVPDGDQPISKPLGAGVTLYRGTIALTDTAGNLKSSASPASTDICWGLIGDASPGAIGFQGAGPGIVNSGAAGAVAAEIETGSFYLSSSTGGDAITEATVGKTVYAYNETTVAATNGGGTRPVAGVVLNIDTSQGGGVAVKMGNNQSTGAP